MKARAVLIDGPERGNVTELDSPYQHTFVTVQVRPSFLFRVRLEPNGIPDPAFLETVYVIYQMELFGERLLVGSISTSRPRDRDLFEALASNTAKDIALR